MDIDLLLYGQVCMNVSIKDPCGHVQSLVLPHPLLHQRDFVMKPLVEIAPDMRHPVLRKTFREIWQCLAVKGKEGSL